MAQAKKNKEVALKKQVVSKKAPAKVERRIRFDRFEEIKKYFKSVYSELKKVHWPTRREVMIYSGVVLIAVAIIGIIIWIFDSVLSKFLQLFII